jgi:ligand-binding SRPBCC domain-containing protein
MPSLQFQVLINAPLDRVWAFHQRVHEALPALSPPGDTVQIEHADVPPAVGGRVVITARGPLGRIRWVAKFTEVVPPHPVVFGEEARFVDEQESGPFAAWQHAHEFERIDAETTRMVDRITYRLPMGPLGWIADKLFVARKLRAMFRYRHEATRRILEQDGDQPATTAG